MKQLTLFSLIVMLLVACNLSTNPASSDITPTTETTPTNEAIIQPTESIPPTNTPEPEISTGDDDLASTGDCVPPSDWAPYTVVAGDTLYGLAGLSGTTVDNIVLANCLADANTLAVGQVVYLPFVADPIDLSTVGTTLTISPTVGTRDGIVLLSPNSYVTVTWNNLPEGSLVSFTGHDYLADGGVYPIGEVIVDSSQSASVQLQISATYNGAVLAGARLPGQYHQTVEAETVLIQTEGFNTGPCAFHPHALGELGFVYSQPDLNSTQLGQLGFDDSYPISEVQVGIDEKGGVLTFYRITLDGQSGWVSETKGTLRGECEAFE